MKDIWHFHRTRLNRHYDFAVLKCYTCAVFRAMFESFWRCDGGVMSAVKTLHVQIIMASIIPFSIFFTKNINSISSSTLLLPFKAATLNLYFGFAHPSKHVKCLWIGHLCERNNWVLIWKAGLFDCRELFEAIEVGWGVASVKLPYFLQCAINVACYWILESLMLSPFDQDFFCWIQSFLPFITYQALQE